MEKDYLNVKLTKEEEKLRASIEKGEWSTSASFEEDLTKAQTAAQSFLKKDSRVNIRISSSDLYRLKRKAAYEGLPYQTLIASILHKYASGHS